MRATDRHIGAAQVLRRPRPAVQWLQVWASGIRAPRRAQHGRAACASAKLGPPVKDDGQRYARQKNLPSTQDLETPSMGRSEPYNGEAAGGMAWGNEPTPSPHEATRVPSSRCVRVLCVKLTSYRRLATPRCMCPNVISENRKSDWRGRIVRCLRIRFDHHTGAVPTKQGIRGQHSMPKEGAFWKGITIVNRRPPCPFHSSTGSTRYSS